MLTWQLGELLPLQEAACRLPPAACRLLPLPAAFLLRLALALARVPNCFSADKFSYFMLRFLICFSLFCTVSLSLSARCIFDLPACGISAADVATLQQQQQQ